MNPPPYKTGRRATYPGIIIARCIIQGDVHTARILAAEHRPSWAVAELRAVVGACREANRRYGTVLRAVDFTFQGVRS